MSATCVSVFRGGGSLHVCELGILQTSNCASAHSVDNTTYLDTYVVVGVVRALARCPMGRDWDGHRLARVRSRSSKEDWDGVEASG